MLLQPMKHTTQNRIKQNSFSNYFFKMIPFFVIYLSTTIMIKAELKQTMDREIVYIFY